MRTVIDIADSNMPKSANYWVLGAKRRASSREYYWIQTGAAVSFGDWTSGEPDGDPNTYVYMSRRSNRKWAAWTGYEYNIICEASLGV